MIKEIQREIKKKYFQKKLQNPDLVIEDFKNHLLSSVGKNIIGVYVIGSYVLNDFNKEISDIDFIVSIKKNLSEKQLQIIEKIHFEIERKGIKPNLNGIYIKQNHLGKTSKGIDRLTYFHEGELRTDYRKSSYYEINPITWLELKSIGHTFYGMKREEMELNVDLEEVDRYMFENINSYWQKWLDESRNYFHSYYYKTLLRGSENAWCVSGVARQLYTLKEQRITSKRKACEYLINKVPNKYVKILKDTIRYRKGLRTRKAWYQKEETLAFLDYSIFKFNEIYRKKYSS